jgi:peptide deformylase
MKIVVTPNDVLTTVAKPITEFDRKLKKTLQDMEVTLINTSEPVGVGLAAPQVGISSRIFLARPTENGAIMHFINPVIDTVEPIQKLENDIDEDDKKLLEGCLSIPNIWGHVTRSQKLTLSYQDMNGKMRTNTYTGFMATIIQHEMDHLNGILFTTHVVAQHEKLYKSSKNAQGDEEFEEISL